jgi:hypothetical protein
MSHHLHRGVSGAEPQHRSWCWVRLRLPNLDISEMCGVLSNQGKRILCFVCGIWTMALWAGNLANREYFECFDDQALVWLLRSQSLLNIVP